MIDRQPQQKPLPEFRKFRPHPAGDRQQRTTVRDLFGVDGWFFDPDADTVSRPWAFAVLHLPGTCTPSGQGWAVREVEGDRRQYGPLAYTRRDAVQGARQYGPLTTSRRTATPGATNGHLVRKPTALVRAEIRGQRVLHVRCACALPETSVKAEFTDLANAATWLDETPWARWRFCPSTPKRITWTWSNSDHPRTGTIWGTCRHHTGWAAMEVIDDLGGYPRLFLRDLSPDAIG
ncbi:hypothetical protein ABZV92_20015 [Streptomyces rubiginosohelvolus]|uniref:hypothetical protein n=1 Tax=Streptomyces rubiginosohelvolus TaxID=67362 RepID=UPI0033A8EF24